MNTRPLAHIDKPEAISLLRVALAALAQDQLTQPISWVDFLAALQWFCAIRGWTLEYNYLSDYSAAIFARDGRPTVGDEERGNTANKTSSIE